jgi:hypothetical protein
MSRSQRLRVQLRPHRRLRPRVPIPVTTDVVEIRDYPIYRVGIGAV